MKKLYDDVKIEHDVLIPPLSHLTGRAAVLRRMEIGDSFFIAEPDKTVRETERACWVRTAHNIKCVKIMTRTVVENGVVGVRIWRTS